jgi:drug/metabolite transporter (DMT)-like permease
MGALTGVLMLGLGNGAVVWAELTVPSGIVALIVSTVPIWIVLFDWMRPRGVRPRAPVFAGLGLGLVGMVILIGPRAVVGEGHVNELGALALFVGSLGWALGSVLTRTHGGVRSPLVFSSIQMLAASGAMFLAALAVREFAGFSLAQVSLKSALSWVYLAMAGSIIGYSAYVYLLGVVTAAKAATYAYVNPVIAVLLGWAFANEPIGMRTVVAAAVILAGVAIITTMQAGTAHVTGEHPVPDSSRRKAA